MFPHIQEAPEDPILGTALAFKRDTNPKKVNLGVGAYRDNAGAPKVFDVIRKVEQQHATDAKAVKEYAPIDGDARLAALTQKLAFGSGSAAVKEGRVASSQVLSGTGGLRVAGEFIKEHLPAAAHTIYVSDPTWGNHPAIFQKSGLTVKKYPYWNGATKSLDFAAMMSTLEGAADGASVLLHAVAHNPTGMDPTKEQWGAILALAQKKKFVVLLDNAYQGFASGDLDEDAYSMRLFEAAGMEFILCQSFAKNMGLYGERVGMIHVVSATADDAKRVLSQLKLVIRPMYSSPPIHGAELVIRTLAEEGNAKEWAAELKTTAERILKMRKMLRDGLVAKGTPGTWDHITQQIGMFSFTGLTPDQCTTLIKEYSIYLLKSGRISLAGLNDGNIQYVIDAMDAAVRKGPASKL
mmetsp:Transcript_21491/g.47204  ORF Transcript_21491/g.47204 Transcript_21491/m.47204 type:complete len:409 (+) Transcript_21491:58-1284(+)|eukprot:CAMPEP_0204320598 /NCGR_PEP_ID=MMETSP0469-20131031/7721_1 /ASSEMBLY_ACC=CAM_ASM_000384 /TAXON_ID=2969 /ORGANISM="Oxyrrhis marina" /LENGTH=408 /DNA_ID=CAMNT_0051301863 /DNA_START=49 /DNA_END=1275 /DNA_ORIENTATION=+